MSLLWRNKQLRIGLAPDRVYVSGHKAIGELLVLNDELRELIIARAPPRKLKEVARAAGTLPLREAAMRLVNNRETSIEEINRVTFVA